MELAGEHANVCGTTSSVVSSQFVEGRLLSVLKKKQPC